MIRPTTLFVTALLLGCGAASENVSSSLPFQEELPFNGCECVEKGNCPSTEDRLGWSQFRNLSCTWIDKGQIASCLFEEQFVAEYPQQDGTSKEVPEGWFKTKSLKVKHVGNGAWCAV